MYDVILADDDTLVRTTLRKLINWEAEGFQIIYDAANGRQAWEYLSSKKKCDLLITDMKMPVMDGIVLLQHLQELPQKPCILALSGYDDFYLVRDAFRLGATDYILKTDIESQFLLNRIRKIKQYLENTRQSDRLPQRPENLKAIRNDAGTGLPAFYSENDQPSRSDTSGKSLDKLLTEILCGKNPHRNDFFTTVQQRGISCTSYTITVFEIDNYLQEISRFSDNINDDLVHPVIEFTRQLPQTMKGVFASLSPARYVLFLPVGNSNKALAPHSVVNVCRHLLRMWKNYMNISFSCGIEYVIPEKVETDQLVGNGQELLECFDRALLRQTMKYILGQGSVFSPEDDLIFPLREAVAAAGRYQGLYCGIRDMDRSKIEQMREEIITGLYIRELPEARQECLFVIYQIAATLNKYNVSFWNIFQQDENYYEKITKCSSIRELEIWMINYLRVLLEYMEKQYSRRQDDIMLRARQFIADNYANPELSVASVAAYTGFSEKYFSTRFTKETGTTFSAYLTDLRITKAKELLLKTDLKTYEIACLSGYNSTEHFLRVFRKATGITPKEFRST